MTTPKIDYERLRELASKATPGPWTPRVAHKEIWADGERISTFFYPSGPFQKYDGRELKRSHPQANFDSDYIAAISPDTLLALLDEIECYRDRFFGLLNENGVEL